MAKKTVFPFLLTFLSISAFTQNKEADKANELFKFNRFSEAAAMYEEALMKMSTGGTEKNAAIAIKTKLAYCYRMNNKLAKAESLYAEVVLDEKARSETYLFYGEALMSNGKYAEAKKWIRDYQILEPDDERGALMYKACELAPFIQPYFANLEIEEFPHNSEADDNAPVAWQNSILFSSDRKQGLKLLKEKSGWTGRDFLDIYQSDIAPDGSYSPPKTFSSKLSAVNKNTGNASFTADGKEIYFTRNDNDLNKQNTYSLQLYRAESLGGNRWKNIEKLPFCSSAFNFMHPSISPDGKWLYFVSNKAGGLGGTDLWVVNKLKTGWGRPENLGPLVNTSANEGFPFVDSKGRLFFCSKGHPGYGGFDIFVTQQDSMGNWSRPLNLGTPINSPLDDISIFIHRDEQRGMFTSSRNGGDDDIYLFKVGEKGIEPPPPIVATSTPVKTEVILGEPKSSPAPPIAEKVINPESNLATSNPVKTEVVIGQKEPVASPPPIVEKVVKPEPKSSSLEQPIPIISNQRKDVIRVIENEIKPDNQLVLKEIIPVLSDTLLVSPGNWSSDNPISRRGFSDFVQRLLEGTIQVGECFRMEGISFDPNVWQLTPSITVQLDKLIGFLKDYPVTELEIGVHTESLGLFEENELISELRALMILDYLLKEGLPSAMFVTKGYGESQLLNHCASGVPCSLVEHLYNHRLEIKVIKP